LVKRPRHPKLCRRFNLPTLYQLCSASSFPSALKDQLIFFAIPGLDGKQRILLKVGLRPDERLVCLVATHLRLSSPFSSLL
jgi:hypothetical protein